MLGLPLFVASSFGGPHAAVDSAPTNGSSNKARRSRASTQMGRGSISFERKRKGTELLSPDGQPTHKSPTVESILSEFYLSNGSLRRMMAQMSRDMDKGLENGLKASTIAMLPSFVPCVPDGTEMGKFLAMDLGGTNLRVMLMEIKPGSPVKTSQHNFRTPSYAMTGTGDQLFDFITDCLAGFLIEKGLENDNLALGFTFSYPCDQTSINKAKLIRWTKGFNATGVEGKNVTELFEAAINRNGKVKVRVVALVNDTVGTQVATAFEHGACELGVIIATGTNASYMERVTRVPKLKTDSNMDKYDYDTVIIDTEWGGFGDHNEADYILTRYDKMVDAGSVHPGVQIFDKVVAGMYMGEIARLVCVELVEKQILFKGESSLPLETSGSFPTKYISEILFDEGGTYFQTRQILDELGIEDYEFGDVLILREVCMVVSRRSANLAAAAIACIIKRMGKDKVTIGIDGSTYRYHPFYDIWVRDKIKDLLEGAVNFQIVQAGDGSGKGAALIACIAEKLERETKAKQAAAAADSPAS